MHAYGCLWDGSDWELILTEEKELRIILFFFFSKSVFRVILFNFKRVASGPVMLADLKQYASR